MYRKAEERRGLAAGSPAPRMAAQWPGVVGLAWCIGLPCAARKRKAERFQLRGQGYSALKCNSASLTSTVTC